MRTFKVFINLLILSLSLSSILCEESKPFQANAFENEGEEVIGENFETLDGDIDKIWGSINDDSVRIGSSISFRRNDSIGTVASWNVTVSYSRIIDGLRLRSVNNSGTVGDIVDGGIGYNFASFVLLGNENYLHFIIDAFENYTSSLLTTSTTTPIPDRIIEEWGTINYASRIIYPRESHHVVSSPGQVLEWVIKINSTSPMDGIRLTSFEDSVASGEITEGGIGYNFATVKIIAKAENISCLFEKFENGTYTTLLPTTTSLLTTTSLPTTTTTLKPEEGEIKDWGKISDETKLSEKHFQNYPQPGVMANNNETVEIIGTILGMRLQSLNNTNGLWELIGGGLNESFVIFNFKGTDAGRPYDFNIELFGNSASAVKISVFVMIVSSILFILVK
ncbi:unnamed protein product [Chironomus riparius]|uniref:Uncharacterized protein n=1 Tax=Chironomus riparius TaxID=315576 RepID=A0A9N9WNQ6_9DIPT|nr:unnamed protein product [Chironomus riparius]